MQKPADINCDQIESFDANGSIVKYIQDCKGNNTINIVD